MAGVTYRIRGVGYGKKHRKTQQLTTPQHLRLKVNHRKVNFILKMLFISGKTIHQLYYYSDKATFEISR